MCYENEKFSIYIGFSIYITFYYISDYQRDKPLNFYTRWLSTIMDTLSIEILTFFNEERNTQKQLFHVFDKKGYKKPAILEALTSLLKKQLIEYDTHNTSVMREIDKFIVTTFAGRDYLNTNT